ncbi:uncharacterized protein [Henckelia pumila]|uniref:uncharacterized protein isoform X2 n=1 Tax=Henckelia pumila TaxID=405737 RepID=UPI003C6DC71C
MSGSDLGGASYKHLKYCFFSATMSLRRSIQKISYMVEFRDIQNYFQTVAFFRGKFVFDHRVSVGSSVTNIYGTCLLCACIILFYHGGKVSLQRGITLIRRYASMCFIRLLRWHFIFFQLSFSMVLSSFLWSLSFSPLLISGL